MGEIAGEAGDRVQSTVEMPVIVIVDPPGAPKGLDGCVYCAVSADELCIGCRNELGAAVREALRDLNEDDRLL
jgi:hypothetical protein